MIPTALVGDLASVKAAIDRKQEQRAAQRAMLLAQGPRSQRRTTISGS